MVREREGGEERGGERERERESKDIHTLQSNPTYCESPVIVLMTFLTILGGLMSSLSMFDYCQGTHCPASLQAAAYNTTIFHRHYSNIAMFEAHSHCLQT